MQTRRTLPVSVAHDFGPKVLFLTMMTDVSKKPFLLYKHMFIAIGIAPPEFILVPK